MPTEFMFYGGNILLGVALAIDAFSVSLANGLNEPCMKTRKLCLISGMFAFFQALMPFIGWILLTNIIQYFEALEAWIPWIALVLLSTLGVKMLIDGIKNKDCCRECGCAPKLGLWAIIVQGIATSIDALSAGINFGTYNDMGEFLPYTLMSAIVAALVIALVTFIICACGVQIGKKTGTKLAGKASILGGVILIAIGIEIFITGII